MAGILPGQRHARVSGHHTASTWRTDSGSIDVLSDIADLDGQPVPYADLRARATFAPTGELRIPVASLADIIDSKTRANRAKDRDALPELHELRRRLLGEDP
jgi:hypothetical protein